MWPFSRVSGKVQNPAPPAGVQDFTSFSDVAGSRGTDASRYYDPRYPDIDSDYFPTGHEVDAVLVHWDRPPADENPDKWYRDRNQWANKQSTLENVDPYSTTVDVRKPPTYEANPNTVPPLVTRPTAFMSPSNWRYTRPFDQDMARELNGIHFSAADNNIAYVVGVMEPTEPWRTTYRLDPPNNDQTAMHRVEPSLADTRRAREVNYTQETWPGSSYRLGG